MTSYSTCLPYIHWEDFNSTMHKVLSSTALLSCLIHSAIACYIIVRHGWMHEGHVSIKIFSFFLRYCQKKKPNQKLAPLQVKRISPGANDPNVQHYCPRLYWKKRSCHHPSRCSLFHICIVVITFTKGFLFVPQTGTCFITLGLRNANRYTQCNQSINLVIRPCTAWQVT